MTILLCSHSNPIDDTREGSVVSSFIHYVRLPIQLDPLPAVHP